MKINPITLNSNYYNNKKIPSFGAIDKDVTDNKGILLYRNNTMPYRMDLPVRAIVKDIISRPTPPTIYCYACSDGSEPYTIALELIKKSGEKKAQKYFPIIAKDIDENIINIAKSKKLGLYDYEAKYLKDKAGAVLFEDMFKGPYASNSQESGRCQYYKVSDKLADCVHFEKGDIVKDAPILHYDNSIILCRNVWPYLKKSDINNLLLTFKHNFNKSTSLVLGCFDHDLHDNYFTSPKDNLYLLEDRLLGMGNLIQTSPYIYKINSLKNFLLGNMVTNITYPVYYTYKLLESVYYALKY